MMTALWLPLLTLAAVPQLEVGRELLYRGTVTERGPGRDIALTLEHRALVLAVEPERVRLALFTCLQDGPRVRSARLGGFTLDPRGRLTDSRDRPHRAPLNRPDSLETGFFPVAVPATLAVGQTWNEPDPLGRPDRQWRVERETSVRGRRCWQLSARQTSRGRDRTGTAWNVVETLWLDARRGYAAKVDRLTVSETSVGEIQLHTAYELEADPLYPERLFESYAADTRLALDLDEQLQDLPAAVPTRTLMPIQARLRIHCDRAAPTPYRPALVALRDRLEARARGENPPEDNDLPPRLVEDAVADDLTGGPAVSLSRWRGRPSLLWFFDATEASSGSVLLSAERLARKLGEEAHVAAVAIAPPGRALPSVSVPVLNGAVWRKRFGVSTTPCAVILGAAGEVRTVLIGLGSEIEGVLADELIRARP